MSQIEIAHKIGRSYLTIFSIKTVCSSTHNELIIKLIKEPAAISFFNENYKSINNFVILFRNTQGKTRKKLQIKRNMEVMDPKTLDFILYGLGNYNKDRIINKEISVKRI
jgi:HJR/Mrr/RecB family endonuclease